jgi:hypothetical protein
MPFLVQMSQLTLIDHRYTKGKSKEISVSQIRHFSHQRLHKANQKGDAKVRKLGKVVLFVIGSLLSAAAQPGTGNFNKNFGITGDLSGTYGGGGSMYTFMVGPKLTANLSAVHPFVHVLLGGVRLGQATSLRLLLEPWSAAGST